MTQQLVLIGGGHAHMVTLANLEQFVEKGYGVTIIGPSPFHYYSGMGPGMLSKIYTPTQIRFATRHVVEKKGGRFLLGKVIRVDPEQRTIHLESGQTVSYDVLSFNAGSIVPRIRVVDGEENIFTVKPIEKLVQAQERILALVAERKATIGVIGGGAAALEMAGNIWRLCKDAKGFEPLIQLYTRNRMMHRFPPGIRRRAMESLTRRGVEIYENSRVTEIKSGSILLESGQSKPVDLFFLALGVSPSPIIKDSGLPTGPDGGLLVNAYLQSTAYPEIFGGGDCIYFKDHPLEKVGVYAVRQNPVLFHNLMAALDGSELQRFDPGGDYLLVFNMGDGTGILKKKRLIMGGRVAFIIKDVIDRRFMNKFQAIEK